MAQKLIRDIPDETMDLIERKAAASSKNTEAYIRDLLIRDASEPVIRARYAYRIYGKEGKGLLRRLSDDPRSIGGGCSNFSQEEFSAYERAQDLMRRNGAGDLQKALGILHEAFEDVVEVPA